MLTKQQTAYLTKVYRDPKSPASFGGIDALYKYVKEHSKYKIARKDIQTFLRGQEVYSTHVKKLKGKSWYKLTTLGPNRLVDVDTAFFDFGDSAGKSPAKFIVAIDTFSKRLAAKVVPNIQGRVVAKVLPSLIRELGGTEYWRHDGGSEYVSSLVQNAMRKTGAKPIRSYAPLKSSGAERAIRSLKARLYKYMQSTGTRNWAKVLPDIVRSYNARKHRSLANGKYSPNEVTADNTPELWFYLKQQQLKTWLFCCQCNVINCG